MVYVGIRGARTRLRFEKQQGNWECWFRVRKGKSRRRQRREEKGVSGGHVEACRPLWNPKLPESSGQGKDLT